MMKTLSEFGEEFEGIPDVLETDDDPSVETLDEYGFEEISTDVPSPYDTTIVDQNPGFVEGAHT